MRKDIDYVELYAEKLKNDNRLFKQQKVLIESQMKSSSSFFKNAFKGNFKRNARAYLKKTGILTKRAGSTCCGSDSKGIGAYGYTKV